MKKIVSCLSKPAPFNKKPWVVILVSSILVCFLIGIFQPFGISHFDKQTKIFVVIGFTSVTAIMTAIVGYLFPYLFKSFYNQSTWTLGKTIINNMLIILLISLGNSLFDWSVGHHLQKTFGSVFTSYIVVTIIIGLIPAFLSVFIVHNIALKKNLQVALTINNQLAERSQTKQNISLIDSNSIQLSGDTKESVALYPNDILYLESSGNYVKINFLADNVLKVKQIRTTISRLEAELHEYPYLIKCHRAFIVNTQHITKIEGNSQGLKLQIKHMIEEIPVSRSYIKKIKDGL